MLRIGMRKVVTMTNQEYFERAKYIINLLCGEKHPYALELQDDKYSDPAIIIDNCAAVSWDVDDKKFQVFEIVSYPGVYYYPDGSGEPPSEDWNEVGEISDDFDDRVLTALNVVMLNRLRDLQTAEGEELVRGDNSLGDY